MQVFSVEETANDMFENFKRHHKKAEQDHFVERGNNQGPVIKHLGKPHILTQQNHLGQHECLDQRKPVMEITDPISAITRRRYVVKTQKNRARYRKIASSSFTSWMNFSFKPAFFSFVPSMSYPLF